MSMTLEEAIKNREECLRYLEDIGAKATPSCVEAVRWSVKALKALRPITKEQVEKVWRGEWEPGNPICPICGKNKFDGLDADIWADWMPNFCPHCGAPMTDEAVDMVMERLEALRDE